MTTNRNHPGTRRLWRRVLAFLLALALLGIPFWLWQENSIQVEAVEVSSPRLPEAFDGLTIVQLSDVHGKQFGRENERLLAAVEAQAPDLIAITGDLISRNQTPEPVRALVEGLVSIAPTYYVTGNHEWASGQLWQLKPMLQEAGVTILSNEYVILERDGGRIALAGVEDPNGPADQKKPETLAAELFAAEGDIYTLLLAHRNTAWETYDAMGVDLTLSGHAHGGIVRLPFTDGLIGPGLEWLPGHTAGLYSLPAGGVHMVSRGLGGPRLFNRPHLPVLVLRAE